MHYMRVLIMRPIIIKVWWNKTKWRRARRRKNQPLKYIYENKKSIWKQTARQTQQTAQLSACHLLIISALRNLTKPTIGCVININKLFSPFKHLCDCFFFSIMVTFKKLIQICVYVFFGKNPELKFFYFL